MLPDDFENLSQSVVASSVFANNILACITTKNYWDVVNTFKPLMHLWYAGVLMQAYVVLPLILMALFRFCKTNVKQGLAALGLLLIGFLFYILPGATEAEKFYYLPYRLFEFFAGVLVAVLVKGSLKFDGVKNIILQCGLCVGVLILLCARGIILSAQFMLVATVVITGALLFLFAKGPAWNGIAIRAIAGIGKSSFSIYLWHQVLVAFLYYCIIPQLTVAWVLIYLVGVVVTSVMSYFFLEKPIQKVKGKKSLILLIVSAAFCVALCAVGMLGYVQGGVVRDVPELGVTVENAQRGMHAAYNDRVRSWNRDFEDDDRVKVLVFGDSFGRDFANILSESTFAEKLQISYIFPTNDSTEMEKYSNRITDADVVFYGPSGAFNELPEWLTKYKPESLIFVVGTKNFGASNGYVYSRRFTEDYYQTDVIVADSFWQRNAQQKAQYGEQYIDMLEPVCTKEGYVRVFTDDGKFISQDCRHLTQFGAAYYASILDLTWIADMGTR